MKTTTMKANLHKKLNNTKKKWNTKIRKTIPTETKQDKNVETHIEATETFILQTFILVLDTQITLLQIGK